MKTKTSKKIRCPSLDTTKVRIPQDLNLRLVKIAKIVGYSAASLVAYLVEESLDQIEFKYAPDQIIIPYARARMAAAHMMDLRIKP